jgi:hypothetical protein
MKNAIIISITFLIISCAANKNHGISGMPPCLVTKMDSIKSNPSSNQPTAVTQYSYKGSAVFYITAGCCDQFNQVYNSDCDYMGAPDGGITGKGDGKLTDFFANATNKKVVWTNK